MAVEISLLIPEFRKKLKDLLLACYQRGVTIEVLKTVVSAQEQGSLWQQGRTATDAELKVLALEHAGAPFLASCIRNTKPQETNISTDDLPGFSWYQWAESAFCIWIDGTNKLNWSNKSVCLGINGYNILNEEATKIGLFHDIDRSWNVVKFREAKSPSEYYTIKEIDSEMKKRFHR